jgi:hypothetical protein
VKATISSGSPNAAQQIARDCRQMHQFGADADHPAQSVAAVTYGLAIGGPFHSRSSASDHSGSDRNRENGRLSPIPPRAAARSLAPPTRNYGQPWQPGLTPRAPFWLFEAAPAHSFLSNKTAGDRQAGANLAVSG